MTNILFIHQSAELYGSDKTLFLLLKNLDKSRFNPIVVLPFEGPLKIELENENIKVFVAPVLKLYRKMFSPKNILKFLKENKKGVRFLDELNNKYSFDLVYSNTLAVLLGFVFAKKRNIKHLWHIHEIIESPKIFKKTFIYLLKNKANHKLIYNSKETLNFWIKNSQILAKKSDYILNGLEVDKENITTYENIKKIRKDFFKANEDSTVIGLIGRINSWKGQQLLLKAFRLIADKHPQVKLVFIGSAPPNQEFFEIDLKNKIKDFKLEERVEIIPFQNNIWQFWDSIDIAVVPSTEPEPFGMVAIEAMMAKKPVIAANHGGLTEIVIPNNTGILFEPNNENALAAALVELLVNLEKRKSFGEKGYFRANTHFSLKNHVDKFEKTFEELI